MIILMEEDCAEYGLIGGDKIDTSDVNSPITEVQAMALVALKMATTDLDKLELKKVEWEAKSYQPNRYVVKDNAMYRSKQVTSLTWVLSEWQLVLQGAV